MTGLKIDLAYLFNQSAYAFSAQLGAELADLGITVRDFCVLMKAEEGEHTQNRVAELAMLDKTTMVATLDGLEKSGLAERRVSSSDRRARVVGVTSKGKRLLAKAYDVYNAFVDERLGALSDEDREVFVRALTTLTDGPLATPSHTQPQRRRQPRPASAG